MTAPASLPDLLKPGLRLVFVGINPSIYSVERGHYFARRTNRFWPALSRSRLSEPVRSALARTTLIPEDDEALLAYGIGFTDVVKRPSRNVSELRREDFLEGASLLLEKLERYGPAVAVFQGMMGYRPFVRFGLGQSELPSHLGLQPVLLASTRIFVVPSPSAANAHFTLEDQVSWYDKLASIENEFLSGGPKRTMPPR